MKIALVANRFPSISETFIYNHAAGLQSAGADVTVIAGPSSDGALFADRAGPRFAGTIRSPVFASGVAPTLRNVLSEFAHRPRADFALWRMAVRLYGQTPRALRAWLLALPCMGFDIVHFELSGLAVTWLDAIPLLKPTKIVVSCRGSAEQITPLVDPERAGKLKQVFEIVDRVHCVSFSMRDTCKRYGLDPSKAFVNHPAIDTASFHRRTPYGVQSEQGLRLLSTGRLHWAKGIEFALLSVRSLIEQGIDLHYTILGSGPDEDRLRFGARELGLDTHVTFVGSRSSTEVRDALEATDIYILPSVSEGVSNAALEAMAMSLPVVSTTAGGMAEAITDGLDGMTVPPREPLAMASRIATLAGDPQLRRSLGIAARHRVEREFDLKRQIACFIAEYDALG